MANLVFSVICYHLLSPAITLKMQYIKRLQKCDSKIAKKLLYKNTRNPPHTIPKRGS